MLVHEVFSRPMRDRKAEAVARAAEAETHVAARDMARTELQELQQKIHETEQRLDQLHAGLAEVQDAIAGREAAEQARDGAAAELAALRHDVDAARATWTTRFRRRPRAMILNGIGVRLLAMMIHTPHFSIRCW